MRGRNRAAGAALVMASFGSSLALAAQLNTIWLGGSSSWTNAANWSTLSVPNNGAGNTYNVFVDGGNSAASTVVIQPGSPLPSTGISIDSLTISSGDTV